MDFDKIPFDNIDSDEDFEPIDDNKLSNNDSSQNLDDTFTEFAPIDKNNDSPKDIESFLSVPDSDIIPFNIDEDKIDNNIKTEKNKLIEENKLDYIVDINDLFKNIESTTDVKNVETNINDIKPLENDNIPEKKETVERIVDSKDSSQSLLDDGMQVDINLFNNEFNKQQQEQNILNMNPELSEKPKKVNLFKKYAVALPMFAFFFTAFLGLYLFVSNTNADENNLIKIEENNKVGYIDIDGNVISRPKYLSGTNFYKGYAIVKNHNNLSGVLNGKGDLEEAFGNYFYIERYSNRYITSRFTNNGLKLALLDSNLKELTKYKYDNITYSKGNTFLFTRDDTMGVLNQYGKEIYTYTVDEVDDKNVTVDISNVESSDIRDKYARIKVNKSSTIINLSTGKEVYKYTLDDIYVLDNNVFYIKSKNPDQNNRYIIVKDDKVIYETQSYKRVRIEDCDSNILIGVKDNIALDYINLDKREVINNNTNIDYYYGSGIILEKSHDFNDDNDVYKINNYKKTLATINNINPVTGNFVNNMLLIYTNEDKSGYNFINTSGKVINDDSYDSATEFDNYGYSIVSKDNSYGIINTNGKVSVPLKYEKIKTMDEELFNTMRKKYNKDLFIYYENGKCGIIDSSGNIIIKAIYDSFKYVTTTYPFIVGKYDKDNVLVNLDSKKEYNIKINSKLSLYENYILVDKKYYNYNGKLIYTVGQEG